jgi:hypothetical protein
MTHKLGVVVLATMLLLAVSGTSAEERHRDDVNRRPQQRSFQQPNFQQPRFPQHTLQQQPNFPQPKYQQHSVQQPNFTQQPNFQQRNIESPNLSQRTFGQPMKIGQVNIRNATRINVGGTNYSVWRDGHRVYRDGYWTTFVGLSVLTPVVFGTAYYYPYAYVDAPAPYCDGLTEDGCELEWQSVPTLEGQTEFACVAYCPWNE